MNLVFISQPIQHLVKSAQVGAEIGKDVHVNIVRLTTCMLRVLEGKPVGGAVFALVLAAIQYQGFFWRGGGERKSNLQACILVRDHIWSRETSKEKQEENEYNTKMYS